jgi:hypothetical protein
MRNTWRAGLGAFALVAILALAAPGTASAQIDCSQCTSSNYCEEMCQWGFHGEYYFDVCRNWVYPCVEWRAAAPVPEAQTPFFLLPEKPVETVQAE